ncbi:hypothetical protein FB451DRAFT_1189598 [Mycena latifolia]|nr:hypothetical protein FB451DRAFT_1189598 [Mycena latifolia]
MWIEINGSLPSAIMSPPQLAQELLDAIAGDIQGEEDLKACFLVSRRLFLACCWGHQPSPSPHIQVDRAHDLLIMAPHLARYVRDLTLCLDFGQGDPDNPILEDILQQLQPNFRSLSLARILGVPLSLILHALSSCESVTMDAILLEDDINSITPTFISNTHDTSSGAKLEDFTIWAEGFHLDEARYKSVLDIEIHRRLRGIRKLALHLTYINEKCWKPFLLESDIPATLEQLDLSFAYEPHKRDRPPSAVPFCSRAKAESPAAGGHSMLSHHRVG